VCVRERESESEDIKNLQVSECDNSQIITFYNFPKVALTTLPVGIVNEKTRHFFLYKKECECERGSESEMAIRYADKWYRC
jgi:hypothetical protein